MRGYDAPDGGRTVSQAETWAIPIALPAMHEYSPASSKVTFHNANSSTLFTSVFSSDLCHPNMHTQLISHSQTCYSSNTCVAVIKNGHFNYQCKVSPMRRTTVTCNLDTLTWPTWLLTPHTYWSASPLLTSLTIRWLTFDPLKFVFCKKTKPVFALH